MSTPLVAIVTGGAQGIGQAIAELLLEQKYRVCIADVDEETGHKTVDDLAEKFSSSEVTFVPCDVTMESNITSVFEETLEIFGRVDLLINNAGILGNGSDFDKVMRVNLYGTYYGCQVACQYMGKDNGGQGGNVINISSLLGLFSRDGYPIPYVVSKHGVVGLTRAYGSPVNFEKHGIRFNAICPSIVDTRMVFDHEDVTADRLLKPSFVAMAVIKLLEDNTNGSILSVSKYLGYKYIGLPEQLLEIVKSFQ